MSGACLGCGVSLDLDRRVYPLTVDGALGFCCSFGCQVRAAREFRLIPPPTGVTSRKPSSTTGDDRG